MERPAVNAAVYVWQAALLYLAAPVVYVDFVHAAAITAQDLGRASANHPTAAFLASAWTPLVIVNCVHRPGMLPALLLGSYAAIALACLAVAACLRFAESAQLVYGSLVAHGAVTGCASALAGVVSWEIVDRGIPPERRGRIFALAFGAGPALAVGGSLLAQRLLSAQTGRWEEDAERFSNLFLGGGAAMTVAALLTLALRVPEGRAGAIAANGDSFLAVVRRMKVLRYAALAYVLVYCAGMIQTNLSLLSPSRVGGEPGSTVGLELALRFASKTMAGFALGWLLTRTNPRLPLLATALLVLGSIAWAAASGGSWYLFTFALGGAGELYGLYYLNYPLAFLRPRDVRLAMAWLNAVTTPVALAPLAYGLLADAAGMPAALVVAAAFAIAALTIVAGALPREVPQPAG
jgi:hypothetical protein